MPISYHWPEDEAAILKTINTKKVFIAKPTGGGQGEGI